MEEIWKDIPGFNIYKVSNLGNVISLKQDKTWKVKAQFKNRNGYMYVSLYKNGKQYNKSVHSLVANAFVPGKFEGAEINHKDTNKENNCWNNLEWVTRKENQYYQYIFYHPDYRKPLCQNCQKELKDSRSKFCKKCFHELRKRKHNFYTDL